MLGRGRKMKLLPEEKMMSNVKRTFFHLKENEESQRSKHELKG